MRIKVLAFASIADAWGKREAFLELKQKAPTLGDALQLMIAERSELERYRPILLLARNGDMVDANTPLQDGDEVAIFPPVSGG